MPTDFVFVRLQPPSAFAFVGALNLKPQTQTPNPKPQTPNPKLAFAGTRWMLMCVCVCVVGVCVCARDRFVYVDEETCIGCTNCATVSRSTFMMTDEHGRARVFRQGGDTDGIIAEV
jgi:ferredoxin